MFSLKFRENHFANPNFKNDTTDRLKQCVSVFFLFCLCYLGKVRSTSHVFFF